MRFFFTLIIFISVFFTATASPGIYYNSIDSNQTCTNLKTSLFNLISNDSHLDYGIIDNSYYRTDAKLSENGSGRNVLVERYCSENPVGMDFCFFNPDSICSGGSSFCQCYNKEHVIPKAWFNGSNSFSLKEYTDMHYVWPSDSKVNGAKSDFPIGYVKVASVTSLNGTKIGTSDATKNGYNNSNIFEPIDSFKGDFARAYLYFVTRYQDSITAFRRNNIANSVFSATSYTGLEPWILQLCVKWHKQDPPSAFEKKRNDSVFAIQGNRNPFIDFPEWVEKVFGPNGSGSCLTTAIRTNKTVDFTIYPNPTNSVINIQFANSSSIDKNATIEVIDLVGKIILQQNVFFNNETKSLDVSNLSKGIYMISIRSEGQNNVTSFIKQ